MAPGLRSSVTALQLFFIVAITAPMVVLAQDKEPITAVRARALTKEAAARAKGDPTELVLALDKRFREIWGNFESFPVAILQREDINISLTTPYMGYRRALAEYLRMRRPIADVPWVDAAVVGVEINRVEAPDIVTIAVERAGKTIAPAKVGLRPMSFQNGNGQTAVRHAGEVSFPMSAFAPGATVTVSAVLSTGERLTATLENSELQELK